MSNVQYHHAVLNRTLLGSNLKQARKREGFHSIEAFAGFLERQGVFISSRSLRRYEHGTHTPTCELLAALIKALPRDRGHFFFSAIIHDNSLSSQRLNLPRLSESIPIRPGKTS